MPVDIIRKLEVRMSTFAAVFLALFWGLTVLFYFHQYVFRVLPPVLHEQLHFARLISTGSLNGLLFVFWFFYLVMQPVAGVLCPRYDMIKLFMGIVFVHAVGIGLLFVSNHLFLLLLSEMLMGVSSAFSLVLCLFLTRQLVSQAWYTLVAGLVFSVGVLGAIIGSFPMRLAFEYFHWQQVAYVLFIIPALLLFLSLVVWPFVSHVVRGMQTCQKSKGPSLSANKKILIVKNNIALYAYVFFLCAPLIPFVVTWLVPFVSLELHRHDLYSKLSTGVVFIGMIVGSFVLGILASAFRAHRTLILLLLAISGLLISVILVRFVLPLTWMMPLLFCLGFVLSGHIVAGGLVLDRSVGAEVPFATSVYTLSINLGGTLMLLLVALFFKIHHFINVTPTLQAFHIVLTAVPVCFLFATISAAVIHYKQPWAA